MRNYQHGLSIAVNKFIGEIHFRNTREKRETNRLTLKKKTKKTKLRNRYITRQFSMYHRA